MQISLHHPTGKPNFTEVRVGALRLWFSYETIIAAEYDGESHACVNVWSKTTGKHLNYLCNGKHREQPSVFHGWLDPILDRMALSH